MKDDTYRKKSRHTAAVALAATALAVLILALIPSVVYAHADLLRADPAPNSSLTQPPSRVTIWFTEPIEPRYSQIAVFNGQQQQVDNRDIAGDPRDPTALTVTLPFLANDVYTVVWQNVSATDGHKDGGTYIFGINEQVVSPGGEPPGPLVDSPFEPLLRWLVLLGMFTIVGCLAFEVLISRRVLATSDTSRDTVFVALHMSRRTQVLIWTGVAVGAAASLGELVLQSQQLAGPETAKPVGALVIEVVTSTGWGHVWLLRVGLLAATAASLGVLFRIWKHDRVGMARARAIAAVALAAAIGTLFPLSLVSHGAGLTQIRAGAIFSDYLHLVAAGLWLGGLLYLAVVVPPVMTSISRARLAARAGRANSGPVDSIVGKVCTMLHVSALTGFSVLSLMSAGVLVITGLYNSWAEVTVWRAFDTPYGFTLIAKLAVIAPLFVLGAVNFLRVRPNLTHDDRVLSLLRKAVLAEAMLAVLVLAAAGMLGSLEPARSDASRTPVQPDRLAFQAASQGIDIQMIVQPVRLHINVVTVLLTNPSGGPFVGASSVTVQFTFLDRSSGTDNESALGHGGGNWIVHDANFAVPGNWQATVTVHQPNAPDVHAIFKFKIMPDSVPVIAPSAAQGKIFWGATVMAVGTLIGGVGVYFAGWKTRRGQAAIAVASLAAVLGLILILWH